MDALELQLSTVLNRAHVMETVLYGRGSWRMAIGAWGLAEHDLVVPATRVFEAGVLSVRADFPAHCWIDQDQAFILRLVYDGGVGEWEDVAVRTVRNPGDGAFSASWDFSVSMVNAAA